MPEFHAKLSPSASERWLVCPASIRMEQSVIAPVAENEYAAEGTRAHTRAEIEASLAFGLVTKAVYRKKLRQWESDTPEEEHEDMARHAQAYVEFLKERMAEHPHSKILLEQQVDTGVPSCWGTADAIIVSPVHVCVVDYKYGTGIRVDAYENSQEKLYGVGALDTYGDVLGETKKVQLWIFQPRLENGVSSFEITAKKLRAWRDGYVKPIAVEALGEHAQFNPTEEACRWCPAAGECKVRAMKFARMDFGNPDLLSPEEIADAMTKIDDIRHWCQAVEDLALDKAYSQHVPIPGWKVVRSNGRRYIADHDAAIDRLMAAGYDVDDIAVTKAKGIGELEKIVGKAELPEVLGDALAKSEGKISLANDEDKRPSITPSTEAQKDFADTGEEQ